MTRRFFFVLMILCLPVLPAKAQVAAADRAAIRDVIGQQLQAFLADDGIKAFSFASPAIRRLFGDADRFMTMVRGGYPEVYRHRTAQFDRLTEIDGGLVQIVRLTGQNGRNRLALYTMIKDDTGHWRINGCRLLDVGEESA